MSTTNLKHCLVTDTVRGVLYGKVDFDRYLAAAEAGQPVCSVVVREGRQVFSWDMAAGKDAGLYGVAKSGLLPSSRVSVVLDTAIVVANPSKVIECSAASVASFAKVAAWQR